MWHVIWRLCQDHTIRCGFPYMVMCNTESLQVLSEAFHYMTCSICQYFRLFHYMSQSICQYLGYYMSHSTCQYLSYSILCHTVYANIWAIPLHVTQYMPIFGAIPLYVTQYMPNFGLFHSTIKCKYFGISKKYYIL